jgi:hypothetical protein
MSGFHFGQVEGFKVKPVIALLAEAGPVMVKTGEVATTLPDKKRVSEFAQFAKILHPRLSRGRKTWPSGQKGTRRSRFLPATTKAFAE